MKERSWPSSPLTGAKASPPKPCAKEENPPDTFPPNWVQRHAGAGLPQFKKTSLSADVAIEKPPSAKWEGRRIAVPNPFPEIQPTHGVLHFLSMSIGVYPWFKKPVQFQGI
jgi:hypothetical protein